ncbi:MAG TPA: TrmB family transcriptional regulator [Polyangiaceae bacterium]|nr:TrmB family transcriptional regulator [Polyangiaceae bacterium]
MQDQATTSMSRGALGRSGPLSSGTNLRQTSRVTQSDVVDALVAMGFNLNEGRAYAALLRLGPSTGYEVSQRSGVPRSAVYAVLRRLVDQGAARSLAGNPERFMGTPPEALLSLLQTRFDASGKALKDAIAQMDMAPTVPDAFSVKGYERVLEEASRLVSSAKETLVVSGWPRELDKVAGELAAAHDAGVYVVLFSHAVLPPSLAGLHFSYSLPEAALEDFWEHRLVLVADDRRTLIGATEDREGDTAVLSETAAIAEFAVGQIALDITLLAQRHGKDVSQVMARILGDRVGRLDRIPTEDVVAELGVEHRVKKTRKKRRNKA